MPRCRSSSSSCARAEWKLSGSAASVVESGSRNIGLRNSEVSVLGQGEAQVAVVQVDHKLSLDKLLDRRVDPRSTFKLRRDLFRTPSVGAILVKTRVTIGIRGDVRGTVAAVFNQNRGPCFPITKVRLRPLAPAGLPNVDRREDLVVFAVGKRVAHFVFE